MSTSFRLNDQRRKWIEQIQQETGVSSLIGVIDYALFALSIHLTKLPAKGHKLVMFDLDGTLTPWRESSASEFRKEFLPGVREKCKELRQKGVTLGVITNQRNMREDFWEFLTWVRNKLGIQCGEVGIEIEVMKPNPLMLRQMIDGLGLYPRECLYVGDSLNDEAAALRAGVDFEWAGGYFKEGNDETAT